MFIKFIWNLVFVSLFLSCVNAAANILPENCEDHSDIVSSISLFDTIPDSEQNNIVRKIESCLLQLMDESLKPICNREQASEVLLRLRRQIAFTTIDDKHETLKQMQELERLNKVKFEYADAFYAIADDLDKILAAQLDKVPLDTVAATAATVSTEIGIYRNIVRIKALDLCGSTIERTAE